MSRGISRLYYRYGVNNGSMLTRISCQIRWLNVHVKSSQNFHDENKATSRVNENGVVTEDSLRLVPASASYFTGKPNYTDDLLRMKALVRKYQLLPTCNPTETPRIAWKTFTQYRAQIGERVKKSDYTRLIALLRRLNEIHPELAPPTLRPLLDTFKRKISPFDNISRPRHPDSWGRALAIGRRKSATARAWVVQGHGDILINGRKLNEIFPRISHREKALLPLNITHRLFTYNAWILVNGGGSTGQSQAVHHAIAKALLIHEPDLKPILRKAGCLTRDPRRVERKKPGKLKARKMPAWVKR